MVSDRRQQWADVNGLVRTRRSSVVLLALSSFLGGLVEAAFLVVVTRAALAIADGSTRTSLIGDQTVEIRVAILIALGILLVRFLLGMVANAVSSTLGVGVGLDLRRQLSAAYFATSWATQRAERSGRLQELLGNFAQSASSLVNSFTNALSAALSLGALVTVSIFVDPIASVVVVGALVALGSVIAPIRRRIKRRSRLAADAGMAFSTAISELGALGLEMQTFGVRDAFSERVLDLAEAEAAARRRALLMAGAVSPLYAALAYGALLAGLATASAVGVGKLSSVGAVMLVMMRSLSYGQSLQTSSASMVNLLPFVETIHAALAHYREQQAPQHGIVVDRVGELVADDLSFTYGDPDAPTLRDLSFRVEPGQVVGIIGPSGSGKTTLVQVILGLRAPTSGSLTAGGVPLQDLDRTAWSRKVAFVPQEALLFSGTVAENITFFRPGITRDAIVDAARRAHIHDEIVAMAGGYDEAVGERGGRLSGGQRQRIAIARALVGAPEMLILDEPTSALDVVSESLIRQTLADLNGHVTVIVIAHRLSTLESCDRLMVIQHGELRAFGTHAELSASDAFYREALELSGLS